MQRADLTYAYYMLYYAVSLVISLPGYITRNLKPVSSLRGSYGYPRLLSEYFGPGIGVVAVGRTATAGRAVRAASTISAHPETSGGRNRRQTRAVVRSSLIPQKCSHGLYVKFRREVRATHEHPKGRIVDGDFNILEVDDSLAVIASMLPRDLHKSGPELLWTRSYPLALSPFVTSLVLKHTVEKAVADTGWQATCVDASGYCTESRVYRRDTKRQDIACTFAEMAQQERNLHRVELVLCDKAEREQARFSVDRAAQVTVRSGDPVLALAHFIMPMSLRFQQRSKELSIERATKARDQRAVVLTFPEDTFSQNEDLEILCDAIRKAPGLGVTIVHLNPYLLAQVLDYWSGATVGVMVTSNSRMVMVPRCGDVDSAVGRICSTVFQCFGEGVATVEKLGTGNPGDAGGRNAKR